MTFKRFKRIFNVYQKFWWFEIEYLYGRFFDEGFSYRAAALAYTTLLSLVPLIIISFTILSVFPIFHGVATAVQKFILANFLATSADVILSYIHEFVLQVKNLSWTNLSALIVIDLLLIYNMNCAFNDIWRTKQRFHLSISFLIYFLVLMISPIILGAVVLLIPILVKLPWIIEFFGLGVVHSILALVLPFFTLFVTFTLFNWALPSCYVPWRSAMIGGAVTGVLFEVAKWGFSIYANRLAGYKLLYGALATIPIFLFWLYICWVIILVGALVCHRVARGLICEINAKYSTNLKSALQHVRSKRF